MIEFLNEILMCKNEKYLCCFFKGKIIIRDEEKNVYRELRLHGRFKSIRIIERLLRLTPRASIFIDRENVIFSYKGKIYRYHIEQNIIVCEHEFVKGMNNPISFCAKYGKDRIVESVLYGEYIWNNNKGPVSIFKRNNGTWKKVYSFPRDSIRHIHGIVYDIYRKKYIIMTGDLDEESGIWEASEDFRNVKPIVKGLQKYRACVCMPTRDSIFYVTDTPLETNYVYKLMEDGTVKAISEISGPCIFGIEKEGCLYFATSVEGDPLQGKIKYRFSKKLGEGVKDRYSYLYKLESDGKLEVVLKIKKDILPMWLFEFGNIRFPFSNDDKVYFCPQSLKTKYGTYVID